jgi:purine-binding chemotaxis protein CheW
METDDDRAELASRGPVLAVDSGGSRFALHLRDVQEILVPRPVSRIFRAPDAVRGVMNLRGDVLPVLDLRLLLELPPPLHHPIEPRIVVVRAPSDVRRRAGLWVDAVGDVLPMSSSPERAPATVGESVLPFLEGILSGPPVAALLDIDRLLQAPLLQRLGERRRRSA